MATTDKAWDGAASNYPDAKSFCDACLINGNPTDNPDEWTKDACKLPVREPNGDINTNAIGAAAAALAGARGGLKDVSPRDKKAAAKKLLKLYELAQMDPPPSLKNMAQ